MNALISGQAIFIVWRESLEAILIVGILYAYLFKAHRKAIKAMWVGVGFGICLAGMLAACMLVTNGFLNGNAQTYFQIAILFSSAVIMTQMVFWMQRQGRYLKSQLESELRSVSSENPTKNLWGVASVAALAVGREGSEAVVYVYSLALEQTTTHFAMTLSVCLGIGAAFFMAWLITKGLHLLKNQLFFQVTSGVLLISAASIFASAFGKLVAENMLPAWLDPLSNPLWDSSVIMDSNGLLASALKMIFGYNPRPSGLEVLTYGIYWLVIGGLLIFTKFFVKTKPTPKKPLPTFRQEKIT